jgi:hypothetical protein
MKDNSFENAMNKIVGQHEAIQQAELRAEKRAMIFGRIKAAFIFLAIATALFMTYSYRDELSGAILPKPAASADLADANGSDTNSAANSSPQGKTANTLKAA